MRKYRFLLVFIFIFSSVMMAQYRSDIELTDNNNESVNLPQSNLILGLFDPNNFSMKHSYSLVYSTFGTSGLALGVYTNSMKYQFSNNLNAKVDISISHSPFSSLSSSVTNKFTGIYLSRAEINYKPLDNLTLQINYRQLPAYNGYYPYLYGSNGLGYSSFYDNDDDFRK
jgi:hypothetical protein